MKEPFGQTGTATPLMFRAASPLPTFPKMKFESRTVSSWSAFGYTTLIWIAPRTSGTGGSLGWAGGTAAGVSGGVGTGMGPVTGALGAERHDPANSATQQQKPEYFNAFIVSFLVARAVLRKSFSYAWVVP